MQMSGEELAPLARTTYYTLHTIVCVLPLTTYLPLPTQVSGEELASHHLLPTTYYLLHTMYDRYYALRHCSLLRLTKVSGEELACMHMHMPMPAPMHILPYSIRYTCT